MKILCLLAVSACLAASAQESQIATNAPSSPPIRIRAVEAKDHLKARAIVTGVVAEVSVGERLVRVNLEKPFPNEALNVIVFANKTNLFPEIEKLKGKTIEVTGQIVEYRGRPEIILSSTNQLAVVAKAASGEEKK
jgi:DNA/RNA endonuclease YhcR with UshA esterase domain